MCNVGGWAIGCDLAACHLPLLSNPRPFQPPPHLSAPPCQHPIGVSLCDTAGCGPGCTRDVAAAHPWRLSDAAQPRHAALQVWWGGSAADGGGGWRWRLLQLHPSVLPRCSGVHSLQATVLLHWTGYVFARPVPLPLLSAGASLSRSKSACDTANSAAPTAAGAPCAGAPSSAHGAAIGAAPAWGWVALAAPAAERSCCFGWVDVPGWVHQHARHPTVHVPEVHHPGIEVVLDVIGPPNQPTTLPLCSTALYCRCPMCVPPWTPVNSRCWWT